MSSVTNENQFFYKKDESSPWGAATDGVMWPESDCAGYLHKHLTWSEFQLEIRGSIDLNEYKETKKESLRMECSAAIESLIESSVLGSSHSYDCRQIDQHNLAMMVNAGLGGEIYTHDGTEFVMTAHTHQQCLDLLKEMNAHIKVQRDKLYTKVSQINACTTCDEVDLIVW